MEIYNNLFLVSKDSIMDQFRIQHTTINELIYLKKIINEYIEILLNDEIKAYEEFEDV